MAHQVLACHLVKSFLVLLLSALSLSSAPFETLPNSRHIPEQYIITLQRGVPGIEVASRHGLARKLIYQHALNGFSATVPQGKLDALSRDNRVLFIEPDLEVFALAQTIPSGVRRIGGTLTNGTDNRIDVDIAILDTGIDLTHPDLSVYRGVSFTTNNTTGNDGHGHGTHVAGIAAALDNSLGVVGVAPGARLWAVKVLTDSGSGPLSSVIAGVDYVTEHASEIEVANMSLGGLGLVNSLRYAISNSVAAGVVYVVAAGNSSYNVYGSDRILGNTDDFFPSSYSEVMAITALVDTDGKSGGLGITNQYGQDDTLGTFSNYGSDPDQSKTVQSPGGSIDIAAPGVNIYSTYKGGSYATMTGTSMASPHAAGAVALYISQFGRAQNADNVRAIRQALINLSTPQTNWGINPPNPNPFKDFFPEGLLNISSLLPSTNTPPSSETNKIINAWVGTDKTFYYNKQKVTITALATEINSSIWNANARIIVQAPNTRTVLSVDVPTNAQGQAITTFNINYTRDGRGTYHVTVTFSKPGYTTATVNNTFGS